MSNGEKLVEAFAVGLQIDKYRIVDDLKYGTIKEWDSRAHMAVVAQLEHTSVRCRCRATTPPAPATPTIE